jgi:hypothetical protein
VSDRLRIVVLGMMGRSPFGGQTWLYLNWLRGLAELGHDVWYVEDDESWPYDPVAQSSTDDCVYAVEHVRRCASAIGLGERWAFRFRDDEGGDRCWGLSPERLDTLFRDCDALLNVVGATDLREVHMAAPLRVYVQTDPVGAELKLACGDEHTRDAFAAHDVIATYGENYGAPDCGVPLNGAVYRATRQPVDLDLWSYAFDPRAQPFTTIGNYRTSGYDVDWNGQTYTWSKHHEWERFIDLPSRVMQELELSMSLQEERDREHLERHGWHVVSPAEMSLDAFGSYRSYIRDSRGEFTVAKDQNVRLRSGWFSERDACYLASGKPVVAQDTGFGNVLPTGEGLFAVSDVDEAAAAIEAINSDYERHCRTARAIAEEFFDAPAVAARLLEDVGLA